MKTLLYYTIIVGSIWLTMTVSVQTRRTCDYCVRGQVHWRESNESESSFVHRIFEGYDNHPPEMLPGKPVTVEINYHINSFSSINVIDMDYTVDFLFRQRWRDIRLQHRNHGGPLSLNSLKKRLWVPDTYFRNAKSGKTHEITTPNIMVRLYPNGTVIYSQKLSVTLSCFMDLWKFPMDTQFCSIEASSYGYESTRLQLIWWQRSGSPISVNHEMRLNEFEIPKFTADVCSSSFEETGNFSCVVAGFQLHRKMGFYLIYTIVPSILVVAISWVSFCIDFQSVPARVSIGLLCILSLMTQGASTVQKLPRVSYVKAIDIWLFSCLSFVFASLIEFALVNVIALKATQRNAKVGLKSAIKKDFAVLTTTIGLNSKAVSPTHATQCLQNADNVDSTTCDTKRKTRFLNEAFARKIDRACIVVFPLAFIGFNLGYWPFFTAHL